MLDVLVNIRHLFLWKAIGWIEEQMITWRIFIHVLDQHVPKLHIQKINVGPTTKHQALNSQWTLIVVVQQSYFVQMEHRDYYVAPVKMAIFIILQQRLAMHAQIQVSPPVF